VVRNDIHFANECKLDANNKHLYVVQTAGRNVVRFAIQQDGELTDRMASPSTASEICGALPLQRRHLRQHTRG
jgi:sugar lactone lactonase YvrE